MITRAQMVCSMSNGSTGLLMGGANILSTKGDTNLAHRKQKSWSSLSFRMTWFGGEWPLSRKIFWPRQSKKTWGDMHFTHGSYFIMFSRGELDSSPENTWSKRVRTILHSGRDLNGWISCFALASSSGKSCMLNNPTTWSIVVQSGKRREKNVAT